MKWIGKGHLVHGHHTIVEKLSDFCTNSDQMEKLSCTEACALIYKDAGVFESTKRVATAYLSKDFTRWSKGTDQVALQAGLRIQWDAEQLVVTGKKSADGSDAPGIKLAW